MSIFKGLASRKPDPDKLDADGDEPVTGKLVSMREHQKASNNLFADDEPAQADDASVRNMWDLVGDPDDIDEPEVEAPPPAATPEPPAAGQPQPAPTAEAPARRSGGRVKTRLLGFDHSNGTLEEIGSRSAPEPEAMKFPVGWMVIVEGPGRGTAIAIGHGVSQIGRDHDQAVSLDFGDTAISREGHAMIAYDNETRSFYLGHGGKSNLVRLNDKPVLSTEQIKHGDRIRVGETTLMLAALCGESFSWAKGDGEA